MIEVTKKKIDKEVRNNRLLKIVLIVIIIITLFISLFVLINESKNKNYNDGYTIMINYSDYEEHDLKLGFDPTFDTYYNKLVGLGYGTVNSNIGLNSNPAPSNSSLMMDKTAISLGES